MNAVESVFYWLSAVFLAASFFFAMATQIFNRAGFFKKALALSLTGLGLLTIFGILRWVEADHPPFVSRFESMVISAWFILAIFHLVRLFNRGVELLCMPLSLVAFLFLGWASSMETAASPLSTSLENIWLFIHASFATSGASAFVIAASYSAIYLRGEEKLNDMAKLAAKVPTYKSLPEKALNFLIFGLILWGVMIVSGSIWANAAWGRYWAWDPIEIWSLISWLLYGLVLHTRLTFKISKRTFSWLTIIAALTVIFALWGVGYIYETIHSYG